MVDIVAERPVVVHVKEAKISNVHEFLVQTGVDTVSEPTQPSPQDVRARTVGSMADARDILLISGSLRSGSTNSAVLRTAHSMTVEGVDTVLYAGMGRLPHFNPDDDLDPLRPAVADLRARIAGAEAILFCTPEYAGGLPGAFKNLLDWTVGGGEIYQMPVGWINASGAPLKAAEAHDALRRVLGYVSATIIPAACVHLPVARHEVGPDGVIGDPSLRARVAETLLALANPAP